MPPIAFKQAITPVLNSTTLSTVLTYSIAPGDFVVVPVVEFTSTATSVTVTDNGGNTYTAITPFVSSGNPSHYPFFTLATQSATSITVTVTAFSNSWAAGAVSYLNAFRIGNTGNQTNAASTIKTITGTITAVTNWMGAILGYRSSLNSTATSGNLRAFNAGATQAASMDNTGALSLTCSLTTTQSGVSTGVFFELIQNNVTLSSISPNNGTPGNNVPVTLTGSGFSGGGAVTINFSVGAIGVSNLVVVNDTTITATFVISPSTPVGNQNVTVSNLNGTSNAVVFTVNAPVPTVSAISPAFGTLGTTIAVTITGTGFVSPATVQFTGTGVTASNVVVVNSTTITANITIAANANIIGRTVSVTTPGGTSSPPPFIVFGIHFVIPRNRAVIKYGFLKRKKERESKTPHPSRPKRG